MDSGKIVESGTHRELLKNKKGTYTGLYEISFKNRFFIPTNSSFSINS